MFSHGLNTDKQMLEIDDSETPKLNSAMGFSNGFINVLCK